MPRCGVSATASFHAGDGAQGRRPWTGGKARRSGGAADPAAIGNHAHPALFRDAIRTIQGKASNSIDGKEGRRSVEIILAIYKAASSGKAVQLPLRKDPIVSYRKTGVKRKKR